ncbi:MAG: hypothetical protein JWL62_1590, partial [Hyphomicrobiales bacterium]|nr:hypothetical protein [Hyphomicrobiales bacterium]
MKANSAIEIVQRFWNEVWHFPQNPEAIDALVHKDFVITSGGHDIPTRDAFKAWVVEFQRQINDLKFEVLDIFESPDGTRVATRWRLVGRNNGFLGTKPD